MHYILKIQECSSTVSIIDAFMWREMSQALYGLHGWQAISACWLRHIQCDQPSNVWPSLYWSDAALEPSWIRRLINGTTSLRRSAQSVFWLRTNVGFVSWWPINEADLRAGELVYFFAPFETGAKNTCESYWSRCIEEKLKREAKTRTSVREEWRRHWRGENDDIR